MIEPRSIAPEDRLTARQRWVVFAMNLFLLAELTWAMYLAQHDPENTTEVFLMTFLPAVVVTLVGTRIVLRKMQRKKVLPDDPRAAACEK